MKRCFVLAFFIMAIMNQSTFADGFLRRLKPQPVQNKSQQAQYGQAYQVQKSDPCDCCSTPTPPCGPCNDVCKEYTIKPGTCSSSTSCTPIPVVYTTPVEPSCEKIPYYINCKKERREALVPKIVETCREFYRFKTIKINICCEIEVCVPCEKCCEKKKECKAVKECIDVDVCELQGHPGHYDVYALNVPGMPTKFVLARDISLNEVNQRFPRCK